MDSYGWLLDPKKCIECRACEAACKQWNKVETGVNVRRRKVNITEMGAFPKVALQAISMSCNHCENALCMRVCPAKAIWRRDDGIVLVNQEACLGCTQCGMFCPYGAPQYHPVTRKMEKCTMCFDRIEQGMQPACATLCPTGALTWGKWDDISRQGVPEYPNVAPSSTTKPHLRFIAKGY